MNIKVRNRAVPRMVISAASAMLMLLAGVSAWAQVTTTVTSSSSVVVSEQQRLQQLGADVSNLQVQGNSNTTEITKIEKAITVAPPADANAKPATVGEHVGLLEKNFGDLKNDLATNLGIHVHGLVDAGYEYNVNRPDTANSKGGSNAFSTGGSLNQLRVFDPNANSFSLTQGNIHIDRTVDSGVGFVTDINFGNVANVLGQATRYSNINPAGASNTIVDPTQFYLTYTAPVGTGINFSAGRFVTLLGEEVIPVYNNLDYNETRSFLFGFAIPFTHTGIRAQYTVNDYVGGTIGVNNGWDDMSDGNDGKTVEGEVTLNTKDKNLSLVLNGIYGPEQVNNSHSKRGVFDTVVTWKPWFFNGVTLIGNYDFGHETGPVWTAPLVTSFGNNLNNDLVGPNGTVKINHAVEWQGFAGYVIYDPTDALELATRGEWFSDPDGARTGLKQNLGEITQTIAYKIPGTTGLLSRFEYRHDESNARPFFSSDGFVQNPTTSPKFGLPLHTYSGQDTFTAAMIYSF
ncbi:MAG TPA: outer membrane beta-barrel protein [Candidatus Binataceae bacterium]